MRRQWPTSGCCAMQNKTHTFTHRNVHTLWLGRIVQYMSQGLAWNLDRIKEVYAEFLVEIPPFVKAEETG